ncbi:MAG TPA: hypothetical protein VK797_29805 [Tepidisphaeraceae bacterium]|jgi:hypothetical protein|nr:hypothetical protein [Tepidisphaeraceae bacterium]
MAAFDKLDWTRFDVWATLAGNGVAVVEPGRREACLAWLRRHDYTIHTIDFQQGVGPAVVAMGELFRWKEEFGYALPPEHRGLDSLRDGFDFDLKPGAGVVLELLNCEVAHREDAPWFLGLLSISHEYSRCQMALGARFFTFLILPRESTLIGTAYEELSVPSPFWTAARHGDPFSRE